MSAVPTSFPAITNGKRVDPRPLSTVSAAGLEDLEELVYFLLSVREEIDDGQVDDDLLVDAARSLVQRQFGICLIIRGEMGIEASLGLLLERPRLARGYRLRSIWNVVAPAARKTGHAKALLMKATQFAENLRRPLYLDAFHEPKFLKLERPYRDERGCQRCGRTFYERIEDSGKVRTVSRHLSTSGRIFTYVPVAEPTA